MTNTDLFNAMLAVRQNPANASYFSKNASNYIGGSNFGFSTGQLQALASTGTVNILTGGVAYHVTPGGSGGQPFTYTQVGYDPNYYVQQAAKQTPTNTLVPSNISNPGTGRSLTDTLTQGLASVKNYIGPTGLLIGIGLAIFLVVKK